MLHFLLVAILALSCGWIVALSYGMWERRSREDEAPVDRTPRMTVVREQRKVPVVQGQQAQPKPCSDVMVCEAMGMEDGIEVEPNGEEVGDA